MRNDLHVTEIRNKKLSYLKIKALKGFVLLSGNLLKSPSPSHKLYFIMWKWPHKTIQDFENDTAAKLAVPSHM